MDQKVATDMRGAVYEAILTRRSVRAFLDTPVDDAAIHRMLEAASRAPSASNMQPWKVHVLRGATLARVREALLGAHEDAVPHSRELEYYPQDWFEPYLSRRRKVGWQLYESVGIARGDRAASRRQHARNYEFFDAPVGMIFCLDRGLGLGSYVDYGMYLQSLMIAARAEGLDTCPQAALANYPEILRPLLGIPEDQLILCGMSLGYADPSAPENGVRSEREGVHGFVTMHD
ncbi:nitroreductase [Acuticoccus kandeliae]|uniref:nitroreductase n=1 Tax=Acuticoccus kandeliae TaxID=2073160 RepID=UPI000D3E5F6E|nr:nitroreductase [Acuticoccus kandeliae]